MTTALTKIRKRISIYSDYYLPQTIITKYPIFISSLIKRIVTLQNQYSLSNSSKVFDLSKEKEKAQFELKNKGGVYVLWCVVCFMLVLLFYFSQIKVD